MKISASAHKLLVQMVEHGQRRAKAAEIAGITDDHARKLLKMPAVLTVKRQMQDDLREGAADVAFGTVARLAGGARSERVQLEASTWLLESRGEGPIQRSETRFSGDVGIRVTPGYVLDLRGAYEDVEPKAVEGGGE